MSNIGLNRLWMKINLATFMQIKFLVDITQAEARATYGWSHGWMV